MNVSKKQNYSTRIDRDTDARKTFYITLALGMIGPIILAIFRLTGGDFLDGAFAGNKANYPWQDMMLKIAISVMFIGAIAGITTAIIRPAKRIFNKVLLAIFALILPIFLTFLTMYLPKLVRNDAFCDQPIYRESVLFCTFGRD